MYHLLLWQWRKQRDEVNLELQGLGENCAAKTYIDILSDRPTRRLLASVMRFSLQS